VLAALGRDTPQWRIKHTCPACTYKLKGEYALTYKMLVTMDGNDSLKRILSREAPKEDAEAEGREPQLGES
jgi:hypothetical protein